MLLLHISDIHFHYAVCNTDFDPDRPYRTKLLSDVRAQVKKLGVPVDAILLGGDIAYNGLTPEYTAAMEWLIELAGICACKLERIFVVPGNHDVDRNIILNDERVRNAQSQIANASNTKAREHKLREYLFIDPTEGSSLFAPMGAYNLFAASFNCQVYPKKPFWRQELDLDARTKLRIYGLTSTLLSGIGVPEKRDDMQGNLYLSPFQTVLDPVEDIVNLVLCHHPPDWFMDQDDIENAFRSRSSLHMFGHRHRQRIYRDNNYVRLAAAAVNPDRHEVGWEPGYNLLQLSISENNGQRYIDVDAFLRRWQPDPEMFVATMASQQEESFKSRVPVPGSTVPPPVPGDSVIAQLSATVSVEAAMSETDTRNLVFRFWKLPSSKRRDIALRLKLINTEDLRLPEPERYSRALLRAGEMGLLEQVAQEIERTEAGHGG